MSAGGVRLFLESRRGVAVLWAAGTLAAACVALLMHRAGVPGWDDPAHVYKVSLLRHGESIFWDNLWYGGVYGAVVYGFLFYLLALVVPAKVIVVVSAGAVPVFFYLYQRHMWRIRAAAPAWGLAAVMSVYLAHGQDPFVFALALTLGGLAALARGRPLAGAAAVGLGIFANPMAMVVCSVFMVADVVTDAEVRGRYGVFFAALAPFVVLRVLLGWAFAEPGAYLNETTQLLLYLGFALAGIAVAGVNEEHERRRFVVLFLAYAALCVGSFVLPGSPVGNNVGRFFFVFALPLLLLLRRARLRRGPLGVDLVLITLVAFAALQVSAPYSHFTRRDERPQTRAAFFAPALAAASRLHDADHRIHVVALRRHWEAVYFPEAGYPITRGWYRQADAIHNGLFYTPYDEGDYVAWLRRMGVEYVFLPPAPHDAWSRREPGILASSPAFEVVARPGQWTIYRLRNAEPLAVGLDGGEAHLAGMGRQSLTVRVDRPGSYLVKVTWSPYWRLEGGAGRIASGPERFILLQAERSGEHTLRLQVTWDAALAQVGDRLGM